MAETSKQFRWQSMLIWVGVTLGAVLLGVGVAALVEHRAVTAAEALLTPESIDVLSNADGLPERAKLVLQPQVAEGLASDPKQLATLVLQVEARNMVVKAALWSQWIRGIALALAHIWLTLGLYRAAQPRWPLLALLHNTIIAAGIGALVLLFRDEWADVAASRAVDTAWGNRGIFMLLVACVIPIFITNRAFKKRPEWRTAATVLVAGLAGSILAVVCTRAGRFDIGFAVGGLTAMALGFVIGLWVLRYVLYPGIPAFGVARTLIDEAIRMKAALIFIVGIMLLLPVLPLVLSDEQKLSYRIQFFLGWSLGVVGLLLSILTIFLACGSITAEIQKKQIFMTLVKPMARWEYLLGKWLGIILLNFLLVSVAGGAIYTFARSMQHQRTDDPYDRLAVDQQVLVARVPVFAEPIDPELFKRRAELEMKKLTETGSFSAEGVKDNDFDGLLKQAEMQWQTIEAFGTETFVFRGLEDAAKYGDAIQVRLQPRVTPRPPDRVIHMRMVANGREVPEARRVAVKAPHEIDLPVSLIQDGELHLVITNVNAEAPNSTWKGSLRFPPEDGLTVYYQVDRFAPNLMRAMLVVWIKLCFLAMVGIAAGSVVGFPTACLVSGLLYLAITFNEFIVTALRHYGSAESTSDTVGGSMAIIFNEFFSRLGDANLWGAAQSLIRGVGTLFMAMMPSLDEYNTSALIRDGHYVSYSTVGWASFEVGLIYTGLAFLAGWLMFQYRELARVTV